MCLLSFSGGIFDLMASSSSGAGLPPGYGTLSNAAAQASTPNTGTLKDPALEQVAPLSPVQNSTESSTVNNIFTLLGAASLMPWNGILPFRGIPGPPS